MSKESYARGFCKAAEAAGVDPKILVKYAYTQADVDKYKSDLINAGNDSQPYLSYEEKVQPLPSVKDIRDAFSHAKTKNFSEVLKRLDNNNSWFNRFRSSLDQEKIMPKERFNIDGKDATTLRAIANIVRGHAVDTLGDNGGYFSHREIPESLFRGAWPAFTNAINYASAPRRPRTEQIVLKK